MSRLAQLEKLHAADPKDADVPYMIAQEHAKAARHEEALSWYDRCIASDPHYHYAYYHKARSLQAMECSDRAIETLKSGLKQARAAKDMKAVSELTSFLDDLEG